MASTWTAEHPPPNMPSMSAANRIVLKCFVGAAIYAVVVCVLVPSGVRGRPGYAALISVGAPILGVLIFSLERRADRRAE